MLCNFGFELTNFFFVILNFSQELQAFVGGAAIADDTRFFFSNVLFQPVNFSVGRADWYNPLYTALVFSLQCAVPPFAVTRLLSHTI